MIMEEERKERTRRAMDAAPGTEVGVYRAVQSDPLGLGAVKLDCGEWATPLVKPPIKCPQPGDKVMTITNAVEGRMVWIGFVGDKGFSW